MPATHTLDLDLARTLLTVVPQLLYAAGSAVREQNGITFDRFKALRMIERCGGAVRSGELAERSHVTAPAVTRLADDLVDVGLVNRDPDPRDRRVQLLSLTPRGKRELHRFEALAAAAIAELLAGLTAAQRARMRAALSDLEQVLDRSEPDREQVSARRS